MSRLEWPYRRAAAAEDPDRATRISGSRASVSWRWPAVMIRAIGLHRSSGVAALDDDRVRAHSRLHQIPACLRILRSVPVGMSVLGLPARVTVFGVG